MSFDKLKETMRNFDEEYLKELLGDLKDSLIEWSINRDMMTKNNMIEIILSVYGLSLFKYENFRYKYFCSLENVSVLQKFLEVAGIGCKGLDQLEMAKKAAKIPYQDCPQYRYLIQTYFGLTDYEFSVNQKEAPVDNIERNGCKFYELFDYQYIIKQQVINDLENKDKHLYKILVHMPTGTGKTKTTMHIIAHYLNFISKGKGTVIWIAHSDELLKQAYDTFIAVWSHLALFDINVYKSWVEFPATINDGILFTSIQALQMKINKPIFDDIQKNASLIIFDEVHKSGAQKYKMCVDKLMLTENDIGKKFIGLTATPGRTTEFSTQNILFRNDFDHFIGIDVDRINSISLTPAEARNYQGSKDPIKYFQEHNYLSRIIAEPLKFELDQAIYDKLKKEYLGKRDDYSDKLLREIGLNKSRNLLIVEKLQELNRNRVPTIVFACSLQHAKMLSAFLRMQNIDNSLVVGDMGTYERRQAIQDFKSGKVNFIINYEILTTGFDSTNIQCVFITRPTKSVILYSQMIGRGLRGVKMGGNASCKLIDLQDNIEQFTSECESFTHFDNYWR